MSRKKNCTCLGALLPGLLLFSLPCWAGSGSSLKESVGRVLQNLMSGDTNALNAQILSFAELTAMSTQPVDQKKYEKQVTEWLNQRIQEFQALQKESANALPEADVKDVILLIPSKDKKVKRQVVLAIVQPMLSQKEGASKSLFPLVFVEAEGQWKLSIRK